MLRPLAIPETFFDTERGKLRGMNETSCKIKIKSEYGGDNDSLKQKVYETANVALVPCLNQGKIDIVFIIVYKIILPIFYYVNDIFTIHNFR